MDSSHSFFANFVPSARLVLEADFDPQLPSRVLGRFAELGRLPSSFVMTTRQPQAADGVLARNLDDESLRLELEFAAEPDDARQLSRRLLNVPSVRSVELSFRRARMARAAA